MRPLLLSLVGCLCGANLIYLSPWLVGSSDIWIVFWIVRAFGIWFDFLVSFIVYTRARLDSC